jgi:hypothetical protein
VANYKVRRNTDNVSIKTTQDKPIKTKETTRNKRIGQLKLFTLRYELLKISVLS